MSKIYFSFIFIYLREYSGERKYKFIPKVRTKMFAFLRASNVSRLLKKKMWKEEKEKNLFDSFTHHRAELNRVVAIE